MSKQQYQLLSEMVTTAIDHGGDKGGPYNCYKEELTKSIVTFLTVMCIPEDEYSIIFEGETFVEIRKN